MAKHRSGSKQSQPLSEKSLTVELPVPVLGVVLEAREAFHELCIRTGQEVLLGMMEHERERLCGAKGKHLGECEAWRGGSTPSRVILGGRQIEMARLRVRGAHGERTLASFQWAASKDPMDAHTMEVVAARVSARRYRRTLDPLPAEVAQHSTSRSSKPPASCVGVPRASLAPGISVQGVPDLTRPSTLCVSPQSYGRKWCTDELSRAACLG